MHCRAGDIQNTKIQITFTACFISVYGPEHLTSLERQERAIAHGPMRTIEMDWWAAWGKTTQLAHTMIAETKLYSLKKKNIR